MHQRCDPSARCFPRGSSEREALARVASIRKGGPAPDGRPLCGRIATGPPATLARGASASTARVPRYGVPGVARVVKLAHAGATGLPFAHHLEADIPPHGRYDLYPVFDRARFPRGTRVEFE